MTRFICHVVPDDKFVDLAWRGFNARFEGGNRFFIVDGSPALKYVKSAPVEIGSVQEIVSVTSQSNCIGIVFHSLNAKAVEVLARLPDSLVAMWFGWGHDYYDLLLGEVHPGGRFLPETRELLVDIWGEQRLESARLGGASRSDQMMKVINRLDYFMCFPVEYTDVRRFNPWFRPQHIWWGYGTIEDDYDSAGIVEASGDVLVGNSASPENNHLDTFLLLAPHIVGTSRRVVVPLSYGDIEYREKVVSAGRELFGDQFYPLLDYLPRDEYIKIVSGCSFVVMNHARQQAVGNILISLQLGCHVYINADSPLYREFRSLGMAVSPVNELDRPGSSLSPILEEDVLRNRSVISEFWGREAQAGFTDRVVDVFLGKKTSLAQQENAEQSTENNGVLLSVVMPVYNRKKYVSDAVKSVLSQSWSGFEVIVVDDGSNDGTVELLKRIVDPRLSVLQQSHKGGSAARNTGVLAAKGRYVVVMDSDDIMPVDALQRTAAVLLSDPGIDVLYGDIYICDQGLNPRLRTNYPDYDGVDILPRLLRGNCLPHPGTAIRRSLLIDVGLYNEGFVRCHDYELWGRLAYRARFKKQNAIQHYWRRHEESLSSSGEHQYESLVVQGMFNRYSPAMLFDQPLGARGEAEAWSRLSRIYESLGADDKARYAIEFSRRVALRSNLRLGLDYSNHLEGAAPEFSIVLTTYSRPAMLLDALRSIESQTLRDFEVVLVNDHGKPVEELLTEFTFPLTYIYKGSNQGLSAARNTALALARGRYICYLDDDDFYRPEHLAVLAEAFEKYADSVVYTGVEYVSEKVEQGERKVLGRSEPYKHEVFDKERLFFQNYIPVNTWAHPRAALGEVGEFDPALKAFEDWDMLLRLATRYQFVHVPQATAEVRTRWGEGDGGDHIQSQQRANFAELYQELYRRHSDLGSERVRQGRAAQLRALGVVAKGDPTPVRTWLNARTLSPVQQRLVTEYAAEQQLSAAQLMVVVVDLTADKAARSLSLNSLLTATAANNVTALVVSTAAQPPEHKGIWLQVATQDWVASLNALLAQLESDWVMLLQAGDELSTSGLQMMSLELQSNPECRAIYGDALYRQEDGDYGVALRPDFNLDYLLSFPRGVAQNWLFNRAQLISLGGFDAEYGEAMELELILRMVNQEGVAGLGHIPEPLVLSAAPVMQDSADERAAILAHLQGRGYPNAAVSSSKPGQYQLSYGHAEQPLVSVVIIMRDEMAATQRCVMSVLESTSYPNYEILLIDNNSQEAASLEWLAALEKMASKRLQVLRSNETLSCSEANNQAALNAKGDYLLFLRPEVAVIAEHWLSELMNHALRPEVGLVGARTVDADGKVTHAGQVLGLEGPAGGIFLGETLDTPGYMQRLQVDQNIGAVSDSCMLLRKSVYIDVGGMDASSFAEAGAAVDLCLKVANSGQLLVWTPRATLLHAVVQKNRFSVATEDALYERWLPQLARDPAYNANFSLAKPGGFKLADPQISWRPLEVWHPLPTALVHPADMYGCGHYRMIQPFNALREASIMDGALSMGLMHVTDLERYAPDVVVLQRQIGDERLEAMRRMKAFSNAFKVYELDDYLPNLPLKSAHRNAMPKDIVRSLRRGLSFVDRFVVSTEPLAEAFAGFHDDIRVVENRLDPRWWASLPTSARGASSKPRVGWAGGASHTGDLELILDVVKELAGEVEWVFFGMCPDKLRPYVHEFHQGVPIEQYPQMLASLNLDLALAPVEENLFNECKSNLRLLEYGACGYPVVCSDVRCYRGSLPATRVKNRYRDWMDAIRMHLSDPAASQAQGQALHEAVKKDWMLRGEGLEAWRLGWLP